MDHIMYFEQNSGLLQEITNGLRTVIIKEISSTKINYLYLHENDNLFFSYMHKRNFVNAFAKVKSVCILEKKTPEMIQKIIGNKLSSNQINNDLEKINSNTQTLMIVEFYEISTLNPFTIDTSIFINDDWWMVGDIQKLIPGYYNMFTA